VVRAAVEYVEGEKPQRTLHSRKDSF